MIAITAGVALAALYVFALSTGLGRALDDAAMPAGLSGPAWGRANEALTAAVEVINIASLALVGMIVLLTGPMFLAIVVSLVMSVMGWWSRR